MKPPIVVGSVNRRADAPKAMSTRLSSSSRRTFTASKVALSAISGMIRRGAEKAGLSVMRNVAGPEISTCA